MEFKVEPIIGISNPTVYYQVYRRRWFGWSELGPWVRSREDAAKIICGFAPGPRYYDRTGKRVRP